MHVYISVLTMTPIIVIFLLSVPPLSSASNGDDERKVSSSSPLNVHNLPPEKALPAPNENVNVFALPVGQGDATVVQCPGEVHMDTNVVYGGELTIVDIGSSKHQGYMGRDEISQWLYKTYTPNVTNIFLSYPNRDHFNYLGSLEEPGRENIQRVKIYHTCSSADYKEVSLNVAQWNPKLIQLTRLNELDEFNLCTMSAVTLRVLSADNSFCTRDNIYAASLVAKVEFKSHSLLLPGDITGKPLVDLMMKGELIKSEALRLPHHGSCSKAGNECESIKKFVYTVKPGILFSSSGFRYNYPQCDFTQFAPDSSEHLYSCYYQEKLSYFKIKKAIFSTSVCYESSRKYYLENYILHLTMYSELGAAMSIEQYLYSKSGALGKSC